MSEKVNTEELRAKLYKNLIDTMARILQSGNMVAILELDSKYKNICSRFNIDYDKLMYDVSVILHERNKAQVTEANAEKKDENKQVNNNDIPQENANNEETKENTSAPSTDKSKSKTNETKKEEIPIIDTYKLSCNYIASSFEKCLHTGKNLSNELGGESFVNEYVGKAIEKYREDAGNLYNDSEKIDDIFTDNIFNKKDSLRPTTAEIGEPTKSKGIFQKIKDRINLVKVDYCYSGIVGIFHRMRKGEGLFLRGDHPKKEWGHINTLDYNRYPNMRTEWADFTNIDHVILPDPKYNPRLNLYGSKLKGNLNFSAYNEVDLRKADLSQVTELDLTHCKNVNLEGLDLGHLKSLKLPKNGAIDLYNVKLPKLDVLDLSNCKLYFDTMDAKAKGMDFSSVGTLIPPKDVRLEDVNGWPKKIDASRCTHIDICKANTDNLETIIPPRYNIDGHTTRFALYSCNLPKLKSLDISHCDKGTVSGCKLPSLEHLKIKGGMCDCMRSEYISETHAPNAKVEVNLNARSSGTSNKRMFETFKNIQKAVSMGQSVYKDASTNKLCPITENQKEAIKFIEAHGDVAINSYQKGLDYLWESMASCCNNFKLLDAVYSGYDEKTRAVLTDYNKILSQALGMPKYINLETMKYEKTPVLKAGEKINIPPLELKGNTGRSVIKDIDMHYARIKGMEAKNSNFLVNSKVGNSGRCI